MGIHVRWCLRRDVPDVLAADAGAFAEAIAEADFLAFLRRRDVIAQVAEVWQGGREYPHEGFAPLGGYLMYELHRERFTILRLAVHPQFRGIGVGRALVRKLTDKLHPRRRTAVDAVVPERLLGAQLFFRALGFEAVGVLRGWDGDGDGYRMRYAAPAAVAAETLGW
jgi:ribosomal-protein-alanine N-acetyltransferase